MTARHTNPSRWSGPETSRNLLAPARHAAAHSGLALIGGLILNFMPCVLPVLSQSVELCRPRRGKQSGYPHQFLASSLGILVSFLVIASGIVGLKLAGTAIGWGIQFQHPWFIIGLTVIVSIFAYNLWACSTCLCPPGSALDSRQSGNNNAIQIS